MIWVTLCGKHFKLPSPGDFHDHNSWIEDYCSKHNSIQNLFVLHFLFLKDYSLFITSVDKHKCCDVLSNCVCVCNQASASTFVFDLHFTGPDMWPLTLEGNAEFVECVCGGVYLYTHMHTFTCHPKHRTKENMRTLGRATSFAHFTEKCKRGYLYLGLMTDCIKVIYGVMMSIVYLDSI